MNSFHPLVEQQQLYIELWMVYWTTAYFKRLSLLLMTVINEYSVNYVLKLFHSKLGIGNAPLNKKIYICSSSSTLVIFIDHTGCLSYHMMLLLFE